MYYRNNELHFKTLYMKEFIFATNLKNNMQKYVLLLVIIVLLKLNICYKIDCNLLLPKIFKQVLCYFARLFLYLR